MMKKGVLLVISTDYTSFVLGIEGQVNAKR